MKMGRQVGPINVSEEDAVPIFGLKEMNLYHPEAGDSSFRNGGSQTRRRQLPAEKCTVLPTFVSISKLLRHLQLLVGGLLGVTSRETSLGLGVGGAGCEKCGGDYHL
jgi:hypothetical protein